jgi:8-oxo-dGTP pyrophosphatase MutT (NUDIX family)
MDKEKINRAGVIPYYLEEGEIKMLFMKPSDSKFGGKCFQIAKGKQEEGESDKETAFREAGEELGLFCGNVVDKHDLGNFLGRTRIYIAEIEDPDMFGDPDFETGEVKWMTPEEFNSTGRDLHRPIVKAAKRWIVGNKDLD